MLPHFKWPLRTMFWHATARRHPAKSHTERTDAVRLGEMVPLWRSWLISFSATWKTSDKNGQPKFNDLR